MSQKTKKTDTTKEEKKHILEDIPFKAISLVKLPSDIGNLSYVPVIVTIQGGQVTNYHVAGEPTIKSAALQQAKAEFVKLFWKEALDEELSKTKEVKNGEAKELII